MNPTVRTAAAVAVVLASATLMAVLRIIPVSRIWENYSVLYADAAVPEEDVLACLSRNGCSDVIALSVQRVPFVSSITPVFPSRSGYLSARNGYFFDETSSFRLYYVPRSEEKQTAAALSELTGTMQVSAGVDGSLQFPFLVPAVCIAVCILLLVFATHRLLFLSAAVVPVACSFCVPLYPAAAAVVLYLGALFLAERVWRRKGSVTAVLSCAYVLIPCAAAVAIMGFVSPRALLLFLCSLAASAAAAVLCREAARLSDSRRAFSFEPIFPASQIPLMAGRRAVVVALLAVPLAVLLSGFLFSARFMPASSIHAVSVPSPVPADDPGERLPGMADYFAWAWETITFPYRNLNRATEAQEPSEGDVVVVPRYVNTPEGVRKTQEVAFTFDASFRNTLIDGILEADYPAVEKLLLSEGSDVQVAYRRRSQAKTSTDSVSLALMLVALGIPLVLYAYYYLLGRRRYENGS